MAQHIPISMLDGPGFRVVEKSIRKQKYFRSSMKYERVDYPSEFGNEEIYQTTRTVAGQKICFEAHVIPTMYGNLVTNIFAVI